MLFQDNVNVLLKNETIEIQPWKGLGLIGSQRARYARERNRRFVPSDQLPFGIDTWKIENNFTRGQRDGTRTLSRAAARLPRNLSKNKTRGKISLSLSSQAFQTFFTVLCLRFVATNSRTMKQKKKRKKRKKKQCTAILEDDEKRKERERERESGTKVGSHLNPAYPQHFKTNKRANQQSGFCFEPVLSSIQR